MTKSHLLWTCLALGLLAQSAAAHPHVFVEMQNRLLTGPDGKVTGVNYAWTFDDGYAQVALEGMDTDGDGKYSAEELSQLTKENLESIADYGFFTSFRQKGTKLELGAPGASSQTFENNKLKLTFDLMLKTPADPKAGEIILKVYDPEFFIAFDYVKTADPAALNGTLTAGCAMELKPLPTGEEVEQTKLMLSDKPKDWKPEQEEDFGALFAQALAVTCT